MPWKTSLRLASLSVLLFACGPQDPSTGGTLTGSIPEAPEPIKENCRLAERQCTRCHTVERVYNARVKSAQHWKRYVQRMRLQPGAGISSQAGDKIVKCLVYRSFGAEGLEELK